jgi:hypothetical protein
VAGGDGWRRGGGKRAPVIASRHERAGGASGCMRAAAVAGGRGRAGGARHRAGVGVRPMVAVAEPLGGARHWAGVNEREGAARSERVDLGERGGAGRLLCFLLSALFYVGPDENCRSKFSSACHRPTESKVLFVR